MANIKVKAGIERVSNEVDKIYKQAFMYSGISASEARKVDDLATGTILQLARIVGMARTAQGHKPGEDERLNAKLRKVLGFTY